jgi:hypothetical protein
VNSRSGFRTEANRAEQSTRIPTSENHVGGLPDRINESSPVWQFACAILGRGGDIERPTPFAFADVA